jgi:Uma2 family endonuclease
MSAPATETIETILEEAKADGVVFPPGDLYSDESPLETHLHLQQMLLLLKCLDWLWRDRNDYFATGNLTVYYSPRQRKSEDFRGPDFFVVLGTERKPRKSWAVWEEEGKYPNVIVELLSDSTAKTDRGLKKQIYQDIFRTPDYFWFDPDSLEFKGFHLVDGTYLYLGIYNRQLRFFNEAGQLIPTPEEAAEAAEVMVIEERQRAEAERQRAEKLAAKLRELGIDPATEV